jgi:predicted SAM-dependent methyltransferase
LQRGSRAPCHSKRLILGDKIVSFYDMVRLGRPLKKRVEHVYRGLSLRHAIRRGPLRVVIGASGVFEPGWIPTNADQINLLRPDSWNSYFKPESIAALLAEHVWEHLTLEQGKIAAAICYRYLKPGGYLRIAVPDGLFPCEEYREYIKIGGVGGGGEVGGHKVVYTYRTLQETLESAGLTVNLLEYHDELGNLHFNEWLPQDGMIHRSKRFDSRGAVSIIADARKN